MKKLTLLLFVLTLALQTFAQFKGEPFYFTFEVSNKKDLERVTRIISIEQVKGNKVWAVLPWKDEKILTQLGYPFTEIKIEKRVADDGSRMTSSMTELMQWKKYPTYDLYVEFMEKMATDYPSLCKVVEFGTGVNGHKLLALKITDNVNQDEAEPEFLYTSTMHGDETTGFYLMMRYANYLLSNYNTDATAKRIVDNAETWINPTANPDGTYYGSDNTVFQSQRYTAKGIDMNRNYPEMVSNAGQHPDGKAWAKETVHMMDFMKIRNFVLSANFHGGTTVVNYPQDDVPVLHADNDWFKYISLLYAQQAMADSPGDPDYFKSVTNNGIINGYTWYPVAGGRQDWATVACGSRETCIELDDIKTTPEANLDKFWGYNKTALLKYHLEVLNGFYGITVDALTNQPIKAKIQMVPNLLNTEISTDNLGFFQRMIKQGTHNIKIIAEGYQPKEISVITKTGEGKNLGIITLTKNDTEPEVIDLLITESNSSTIISEDGIKTDTIKVCLSKKPTDDIVIKITIGDPTEGKTDVSEIVFNKNTWDIKTPVTVTGVSDNEKDGDVEYEILFSLDESQPNANNYKIAPKVVKVINRDNVSTAIEKTDNNSIRVFPNPVDNIVTINCNNCFSVFRIINIEGKVIMNEKFECVSQKTINVDNLSSGLYVIEFGDNQKSYNRKFYKK